MAPPDPDIGPDLEIGTRLYMTWDDTDATLEGIFIGKKPGKYWVIAPFKSPRVGLAKGSPIKAKCLLQGRVVEFRTRLADFVSDPTELVLLELPGTMQEKDLRSQKRINCFIAAEMQLESEKGKVLTGVLKDISKSGCRFVYATPKDANETFEENEPMVLRCQFPGIVGEQEALGMVTDVRENNGETSVCLQFAEALWWVPPYE